MFVRNFLTLSLFLSSAMAGSASKERALRALRGDVDESPKARKLEIDEADAIEMDMTTMTGITDCSADLGLPSGSCMIDPGNGDQPQITLYADKMGGRRLEHGRKLQTGSALIKSILNDWCVLWFIQWDFGEDNPGCTFDGYVKHLEGPHPGEDEGQHLPFYFYVTPDDPFQSLAKLCLNHPVGTHNDCRTAYASFNGRSCASGVDYYHMYVTGEPHFAQWRSKNFDYQGQCDLVYLHAPDFDDGAGMDVHIRTKIRDDYSFIESAAVRIGSDVFEVSSYGDYFLNGVEGADLRFADLAGHKITHEQPEGIKNYFQLELGGGHWLKFSVIKDIVSVTLNEIEDESYDVSLLYKWFSTGNGMVGNIVKTGFFARDGVTVIDDISDFANEWQCRDSDPKLFQVLDRAPQYPEKCVLPSVTETGRRRLGETISEEEAAKACANWPEDQKSNCIYDAMAIGTLDLALAGAY